MINGDYGNLGYKVAFASSFTKKNTPDNMCTASAYGPGWLSAPNTPFPQEIVLDFHRSVCAEEICIISHQYAIPKEIIFKIAPDIYSWKQSKYVQITKTIFSDNRNQDHKVREMHSASLPKLHFRYLKLIIKSPIKNQRNSENQVGIVSLTVSGTPDDVSEDSTIAKLNDEKRAAVESEDYILAHRINSKLEAYKANKAAIDELQKRKEEAVLHEDFVLASRCKNEIIRLSAQSEYEDPAPNYESIPQIYEEKSQQFSAVKRSPPNSARRKRKSEPSDMFVQDNYQDVQDSIYNDQPSEYGYQMQQYHQNSPHQSVNGQDYDYDDRIIPQNFEETRHIRPMKQTDFIDPDEQEKDEPVEELSIEARNEANVLISELGEEPLQFFYSRSISNRARGIEMISDEICELPKSKRQNLYIRFMYILKLENAPQIFTPALNAVIKLTENCNLSRDAKHAGVDRFIQPVVNRISVNTGANRRMNNLCHRFLVWAAADNIVGINTVLDNLIKLPRKNQQAGTPVKLNILLDLLTKYGDSSLDFGPICAFVGPNTENPSLEVRNTVQEIFITIMEKNGRYAIEKYFNTSADKPKMILNLLRKGR